MAKGKSRRSGVMVTPPSLAQRPRSLSSIPRYRRTSEGFLVDTESGELFGLEGSRSVPSDALSEGFFVGFVPARSGQTVWRAPAPKPRPVPRRIRIADLRSVNPWICLKRKIRREILFALGKSGRNGGRRYRRDAFSSYGC